MSALPSNLNEWLLALTVFAIVADRLLGFWKNHLKEQPEPARTYATKVALAAHAEQTGNQFSEHRRETKQQIEAHQEEVTKTIDKLDSEIRLLRDERRADVRNLHEEIRKVDKQQTATATETRMINQELKIIGSKLDRVIENQGKSKR